MALNKARKLFVFAFSFVLIVCTFVVLSSAEESSRASGEYDTSIRTGISYNYYALDDDPLLTVYGLRPLFFLDDNTACAYFTIYDIDSGQFVDGTFYVLNVVYDVQSQSAVFTAQGSQYPAGVGGDYTSVSYSFGGNHVIVWYGDTSVSKCSDPQSYDWFCESYQVVSLNDVLGGLGYNEGYNSGYNDGYDIGFNDGVLSNDYFAYVGGQSVFLDPSSISDRFDIRWRGAYDSVEGFYHIFGDSEGIMYIFSSSDDPWDISANAVVLSVIYDGTSFVNGYGSIINIPTDFVVPDRYHNIVLPLGAELHTTFDNIRNGISFIKYDVLDYTYLRFLNEVYYLNGYDEGFSVGNEQGYNSGYSVGYSYGLSDGVSNSNPTAFSSLGSFLVKSVGSFFSTELFFGFTIGNILSIICGAMLFFLLIRLLR